MDVLLIIAGNRGFWIGLGLWVGLTNLAKAVERLSTQRKKPMIDFRTALANVRAAQNGTTPAVELARIDADNALRAANHGYLPRPGVPYLHGEGIRTSCVTGEQRRVHLVFEIVRSTHWFPGTMVLLIAQGGVTGFEGFALDDRTLRSMSGRWPANVLTEGPGGWDGLEVPEEAMRTVREFISAHLDGPAATAAIPQRTCS